MIKHSDSFSQLPNEFKLSFQELKVFKHLRQSGGWSDGYSFLPIDFALLSSRNSLMNGIDDSIDKRTSGYRRRMEALESALSLVPEMIKRALNSGILATHVLMDTWFTNEPLILPLLEQGVDVIRMINDKRQRYIITMASYSG
jgi:hypothetical protein